MAIFIRYLKALPVFRHPVVWISVIFLLLGIGFTYPSVEYISSGIPIIEGGKHHNRSGDHLQLYYWFWLIKDNLFGDSDLLTNPYEFNTAEGHLDLGFHMFPFSLVYLLFTPFGDIAAFNLTIWATFSLTAVCMYLLSREYGIGIWGSLISAAIFTLIPFRITQMTAGHLNGYLFFIFPLVLYCHELLLRKRALVFGVLSGISIFALALMEPHLIYYLFLSLGYYLPIRALLLWDPRDGAPPGQEPHSMVSSANASLRRRILALVTTWLSGIAMVIFYQQIMYGFRASAFWNTGFLGALILYPMTFTAAVILYSSIVSQLFQGAQGIALVRISKTFVPLFLLPIYGFFALRQIPHLGKIWGMTLLLIVLLLNFRQLQLGSSVKGLLMSRDSVKAIKRLISLHIPLIAAMALSSLYLLSAKLDLLNQSIASGGRMLSDVRLFTPSFQDLWLRDNPNPERFIYLGYVVMLIIGYGLYHQIRSVLRDAQRPPDFRSIQIQVYLFLFFLSFILSLGLAFGDVSLYEFCYHHIPFFNYPRVPGRMAIIVFFSASLLCGWMITEMTERIKRLSKPGLAHLLAASIAVGILLDFHPFQLRGINILTASPLYETIQREHGSPKLLEIPLWPGDSHQSSLYEFFSTVDRIPRINGYSPIVPQIFVNEVFSPLYCLNLGRLNQGQYTLLKELGVGFITVHTDPDIFPLKVSGNPPLFTIRKLQSSPYLEPVDKKDGIHLFKVLESAKVNHSESMILPLVKIEDAQSMRPIEAKPLVDDTINSVVLAANPQFTEPGPLTRGPHIYLPGGEYEAVVRLQPVMTKRHQSLIKAGILTVHNGQAKLAAERNLTSDHLEPSRRYQSLYLPFSLATPGYAEFLFWYPKKIGLQLKDVTISSVEKEPPPTVLEAESLSGFTGTTVVDLTASRGKAIMTSSDGVDRDFIVSGPDIKFSPDTYRTDFNLKIAGERDNPAANSDIVAELTIVTEKGRQVIAARTVNSHNLSSAKYTPVPLAWRLDHPSRISFRVKPAAGYQFWLDNIRTQHSTPAKIVQDISSPDATFTAVPYDEYPADQFFHTTGRIIIDSQIGRKVIEARQGADSPGYLTFGPYTQLPAGQYQARFHIKTGPASEQVPVLNLEVTNLDHQQVKVLSQITLFGGSFDGARAYRVFSIPFDSTFAEKLEFRTEYLGVGDVRVSKVELFLYEQRIEIETVPATTGTVHADPLASGGKAVILPGITPQTRKRAGWRHAVSLNPGNYQLTWRLKPDLADTHDLDSTKPVAALWVEGPSKTLLAQQALTAAHFETPDYYRIPMNFSLSERANVTFSMQNQAPVPMWLDSLVLNAMAETATDRN